MSLRRYRMSLRRYFNVSEWMITSTSHPELFRERVTTTEVQNACSPRGSLRIQIVPGSAWWAIGTWLESVNRDRTVRANALLYNIYIAQRLVYVVTSICRFFRLYVLPCHGDRALLFNALNYFIFYYVP